MIAPDEIRDLLKRGHLTGSAAARIAGVNPRTLRRWIGGDSAIPYSAFRLIETHVDQEAMIAEAQADHATWMAEMDADTADRAPIVAIEERIWALKTIQQMQHTRCCQLEDELGIARTELAATNRALNALYAERGKAEAQRATAA